MISLIESNRTVTETLDEELSTSLHVDVQLKQPIPPHDFTYDADRTEDILNFTQAWFYREPEKPQCEIQVSAIKEVQKVYSTILAKGESPFINNIGEEKVRQSREISKGRRLKQSLAKPPPEKKKSNYEKLLEMKMTKK